MRQYIFCKQIENDFFCIAMSNQNNGILYVILPQTIDDKIPSIGYVSSKRFKENKQNLVNDIFQIMSLVPLSLQRTKPVVCQQSSIALILILYHETRYCYNAFIKSNFILLVNANFPACQKHKIIDRYETMFYFLKMQ